MKKEAAVDQKLQQHEGEQICKNKEKTRQRDSITQKHSPGIIIIIRIIIKKPKLFNSM